MFNIVHVLALIPTLYVSWAIFKVRIEAFSILTVLNFRILELVIILLTYLIYLTAIKDIKTYKNSYTFVFLIISYVLTFIVIARFISVKHYILLGNYLKVNHHINIYYMDWGPWVISISLVFSGLFMRFLVTIIKSFYRRFS